MSGATRNGMKNTDERNRKASYSVAKSGKTRRPRTEEQKEKIREAAKEREAKKTPEDKQAIADKMKLTRGIHSTVSGTMLDYLREALMSPDEKGVPYYKQFIQSFLDDAVKDPNGQAARMIGQGLFTTSTLDKLDAEATKLMQRNIDFHRYRIRETLFDKQQAVFDNDTDKEIMIICSRRSGKTELNARKIIKFALQPKTPIAYIHLTHRNGVAQIFDLVVELSANVELTIASASKADGTIEWSNGSSLKIFGNDNVAAANKLLGFKYKLAIVDEVGAQRNLKILLDDTLTPLLKDFADSQLVLTGTPPRNKVHYSHKLWDSPSMKKYHWTLEDNPFMPNNKQIIDDVCKKKGLTRDDPFIRREFMGDMDAVDVSAQVYKNYQVYEGEIPESFIPTHAYIGVDYGGEDYNGVIALLCNKDVCYVMNNEKRFNHATASEIAQVIMNVRNEAKEFCLDRDKSFNLGNLKVITDNNVKPLTWELGRTYGIENVHFAYKYDKPTSILQLADLLRTKIYIPKGGICEMECENTIYKRDENDEITNEIDDNMFHPDILDALRYASRSYLYEVLRITKGLSYEDQVQEELKDTYAGPSQQSTADYIFGN